jgi:CNT family concentrative nucleoside transporter
MVCGTSCVAASVMILYGIILKPIVADSIKHIISAVLISIPGALAISRIMVPETKKFTEGDDIDLAKYKGALDAISGGILDGAKVAINVIAMLIGFVALVEVFNQLLSLLPNIGGHDITMQRILGLLLAPVTWIIGIPTKEIFTAGSLLGTKIVLNEIIAFNQLVNVAIDFSDKSKLMMIYVLCSFANIGSIGVMMGVYNALVPERKQEIITLSFKSIIAGTLANLITASIVGVML